MVIWNADVSLNHRSSRIIWLRCLCMSASESLCYSLFSLSQCVCECVRYKWYPEGKTKAYRTQAKARYWFGIDAVTLIWSAHNRKKAKCEHTNSEVELNVFMCMYIHTESKVVYSIHHRFSHTVSIANAILLWVGYFCPFSSWTNPAHPHIRASRHRDTHALTWM